MHLVQAPITGSWAIDDLTIFGLIIDGLVIYKLVIFPLLVRPIFIIYIIDTHFENILEFL